VHPSFHELVADPSVDVVAVCVPPADHAGVAIAALAAGKHVYLEKPIAVSLADASAVCAAAERATGRLVLGFNLRSHRLVLEAREMIRRGTLGRIELVRTSWTCGFHRGRATPGWKEKRAAGGGAFYEIAVHHLDLLRFMLDDEIASGSADVRCGEVADEDALINARMRSGVLASVAISQRTTDGNDIAVYGERGMITFSCYRADSLSYLASHRLGGGVRARLAERVGALRRLPAALDAARRGGDYQLSYTRHWQRFADAIRSGTEPAATAADGERALLAATAAIRSVDTGAVVTLDGLARSGNSDAGAPEVGP
jgi:predicted dehydrogenase